MVEEENPVEVENNFMGDKKATQKSSKANSEKKEKKRQERLIRQTVVSGFSKNEKKVLNHKKSHGRHSKNGDK